MLCFLGGQLVKKLSQKLTFFNRMYDIPTFICIILIISSFLVNFASTEHQEVTQRDVTEIVLAYEEMFKIYFKIFQDFIFLYSICFIFYLDIKRDIFNFVWSAFSTISAVIFLSLTRNLQVLWVENSIFHGYKNGYGKALRDRNADIRIIPTN